MFELVVEVLVLYRLYSGAVHVWQSSGTFKVIARRVFSCSLGLVVHDEDIEGTRSIFGAKKLKLLFGRKWLTE